MDFSDVIYVLEDEKAEIVRLLRKSKRRKQKFGVFDAFSRKISGDMSYAEEISYYERLADEYTEAIKVIRREMCQKEG